MAGRPAQSRLRYEDQRRRQEGGGSPYHPPVGCHDGLAETPLIGRAVRSSNLLGPCGGWEFGRAEPPQCVPRELIARDAGTTGVVHEATEALGERRRLFDAAADQGRRNLGAAL